MRWQRLFMVKVLLRRDTDINMLTTDKSLCFSSLAVYVALAAVLVLA